jgi:hypothetical protein
MTAPTPALTASANGLNQCQHCSFRAVGLQWQGILLHGRVLEKGISPKIELMHCHIIDVGRVRILRQAGYCLTEVFLFVSNVVLGACDYTRVLNALNSLSNRDARQNWIGTEAWNTIR